MPQGKLIADGSTDPIIPRNGDISVSLKGTFGGGTVTLERKTNGTFYPVIDRSTGSPVTSTVNADYALKVGGSAILRLTLTGSTAPAIDWQTDDYHR